MTRTKPMATAALAASLGALPLAVLLLDIPPDALAGCGYGCGEPACFSVEISTNYGDNWQRGSAWVYGEQGATVDLYLRVTLTTSVGQVQGWSFGLEHTAPSLIGVDGGDFVLRAGEAGLGVDTVQAGYPPDFQATKVWDCGLTQGVAIDYNATGHTLGPTTDRVIALACYRLTVPSNSSVHQVKLDFKDVVGSPPVRNLVAREGSPLGLCKGPLTINVQASEYYSTASYCPLSPGEPAECASAGREMTEAEAGLDEDEPPSVEVMVREGVELLLAGMETSPCTPSRKDRWLWHGSGPDGFFQSVAVTAICAEAILSAPGYDPDRGTAIANATDFLLLNADSITYRCPGSDPTVTAACDPEAWAAFPLQFFIRLQELNRVPRGRQEAVVEKTDELIDALLDCIDTSGHGSLPRYVQEGQTTWQAAFKLAPALLALKRAEMLSARLPGHPYCFDGTRRTKLRKALDALYRSRVCGEIDDNPTPFEPVGPCTPCDDLCDPAVCVPPCTPETCQGDGCSGHRLHGGAFTYTDRLLASQEPRHTEDPPRATVPGSAGRTPICEAALHAWGWPPGVSDETRVARIRAAIDAFFNGRAAGGEIGTPIYDLYLEAFRDGLIHEEDYGIAKYYFLYAHWSAAVAIEMLPLSERPAWRDLVAEKLGAKDVRGYQTDPRAWNDQTFPQEIVNAKYYGTGIALLSLLAGAQEQTGLCVPMEAPALFFRRGDVNASGEVDISDAIATLDWLFLGGSIDCEAAADADDDEGHTITDPIYLLMFLFLGGPPPPAPYPHCAAGPRGKPFGCEVSGCASTEAPNITQMPGNQSETAVAINPCNPDHVIVISNRWDGYTTQYRGLFRAVSWDGGLTWPIAEPIFTEDREGDPPPAFADPSAAFDRWGNLYVAYAEATDNIVVTVAVSTDGGVTFPFHTSIPGNPEQPTIVTGPFDDPRTPEFEDEASVWVTFRPDLSQNHYRIVAAGARVRGLIQCAEDLEFTPYDDLTGDCYCNYGDIAVGPRGEVVVTYQDKVRAEQDTPPEYCDDLDQDPGNRPKVFVHVRPPADPANKNPAQGGADFGPAIEVARSRVCGRKIGGDEIPPYPIGAVVGPVVACDQRPEGGGRVYLAYLDEDPDESDDTDVYVIYSDDLFLFGPEPPTWSAPVRVTDDSGCSPSSGCAQFHQDIDVDQTTGQVVVAWHDAREDPDNEKAKAYAAYSTQLDPLAFSANFAVRDSESDWRLGGSEEGRLLYGDYAGVAFRAGVFFFAGGDNSDHPLNPDRKAEVFVTPHSVPPEP